jgi:aspartate aminotransferase
VKPLSERLSASEPSATVAVADRARRLKAQGVDVITLATGDPDFPTPPHIVEAAERAMRAGDTHYPPARGRAELVEAIVDKLGRENGVTVAPGQVIVTPGAKWALFIAIAALIDPGDEVLVLDPSWVSYGPMVSLNGGRPVRIGLDAADGYAIREAGLRAAISERTKAILVNSPNNPTGRMLTDAELAAICAVARDEDLWLVTDEIYEHIRFDGRQHASPATQPGMAERTIIINGFSKAYAMTGWRLGWLAAPEAVATLAMNLHSQGVTSAASFAMAAGVAALTGPQDVVGEMVAEYGARRSFMVDALNAIPGIRCAAPDGAFYLFPRFGIGPGEQEGPRDSVSTAEALLEATGIAAVPGVAFGEAGEGHLRLTVATARADLERAVERIAAAAATITA